MNHSKPPEPTERTQLIHNYNQAQSQQDYINQSQPLHPPLEQQQEQDEFMLEHQKEISFNNLVQGTLKNYIGYFFILVVFLENMFFVSQLQNNVYMGALGLSYMVFNVISVSLAQGLNNALTTLIAQTFGAKQLPKLSLYYNQAIYFSLIILIPILCIFCITEYYLVQLGVGIVVATETQRFLLQLFPSLVFQSINDITASFLVGQQIFYIHMTVLFIGALINPVYCYYFIFYMEMELEGLAYAIICLEATMTLLFYLAIKTEGVCQETFVFYHYKKVLATLMDYLKIVLPELVYGNLVRNSEIVYLICAGLISPQALLVFSIFIFCKKPFDVANVGLCFACSSYVSLMVGQKDEVITKSYYKSSLTIAGILASGIEVFFLFFGFKWLSMYSNSQESGYDEYLIQVVNVYLLYIPAETYELTLSSILRATGLETQVLCLYFVVIYVFGVILIVYLAFIQQMQFYGLLLGVGISVWCFLIAETILIYWFDWGEQFEEVGEKFVEDKNGEEE